MRFLDLVAFAAGALRGHRLRTALSVGGVAVGIAAVVALTALGEGARRYVVEEFAALGSNLLIVLPGKVETTGAAPFGGVTHDLTIADLRAIARLPRVRKAAPMAVATDTVRYRDRGRDVPVLGTTAEFIDVRHMEVASGEFLPAGDPDQGGTEMVLGQKAAFELFRDESPLGRVVRVGPYRFRVVGVLAPRGRSLGFDLDDVVFVPVRTAMRAFNRTSLFRILIEVRVHDEMDAAKRDVLALLDARHRVEDVTVFTQDALLSAFGSILRALTLALVGIASVSLAVAGVGIMNVMLVSVTERRAEIGLLKALGAADRQVLAAFLAEAVLLALGGGIVGLGAGAGAVRLFVEFYPSFPASPPVWAVVAALGLSVAVGVAFGVWPARRATRLDPVVALARR
ncbi:MAG TPA: ABC transporter permease [Thermoanaerobaculaceae bacterium]|nr:ABC transporter permease [Thermoanaerobaculaceae bacterium]